MLATPVLAAIEAPFGIAWSIILLIVAIAIGLFLIRAAFSLVKLLVVVAIGVGVYLLVRYILNM